MLTTRTRRNPHQVGLFLLKMTTKVTKRGKDHNPGVKVPLATAVSFLHLSQIAAQMLDMHLPFASGTQVWFAQPDALGRSLGLTVKEVRSTIFFDPCYLLSRQRIIIYSSGVAT